MAEERDVHITRLTLFPGRSNSLEVFVAGSLVLGRCQRRPPVDVARKVLGGHSHVRSVAQELGPVKEYLENNKPRKQSHGIEGGRIVAFVKLLFNDFPPGIKWKEKNILNDTLNRLK